jgi:choline-sulfatase
VPNILVPPGGVPARRIDAPVQSIDLTATFVDVAGASLPTCEGRSLMPFVHGSPKTREVVYSELAGLQNEGNYFVMAATEQHRYVYDKLNRIPCELYDLMADPHEMHNLVGDPTYAAVQRDMHKDYVEPFLTA